MKRPAPMTKAELIRRIKALEKGVPTAGIAFEHERLLHEQNVHKTELETQNRELREAQLLLERSRARYADLYDFAPVGYVTSDDEGIIREINLAAAGMLGVERSRLVGVPFHLHVAREDLTLWREHLARLSQPDACAATELRLVRKGNGTLPVLMQSVLVHDVETNDCLRRTALTDITHRKQAEDALREQTQRYRSLVEVSPDAIFVLKHLRITFINPEGLRLLGAESTGQVLGRSPFDFFRRNRHEAIRQRLDNLSQATGASPLIDEELVRLDGSTRWVTISSAMFTEAGETAVQFILRDITDRRRLENEILEISDREQRRIGHDLHDGLGQQLTGLEMQCFVLLEDLAAKNWMAGRARLRKQVQRMSLALRECITVTRSLARGLTPVNLNAHGLASALKQLAHRTHVPGRLACHFVCRTPFVLDDSQTAMHLYRIAQEAVNNALKHARTRRIHISLAQQQHELRLQIKDDGRGLPKSRKARSGMGLEVMRHRAHYIGATLEIDSKPGQGVRVICTLPLARHDH